MRKPDFFIVGAPKCGTTAMYYYLKQHPEIFMPQRKEPHFFGTDLEAPYPYFIREKREYLSLFSEAQDEKRVGEASVWYLYSKLAAAEIKEFCPSASIIIMLRNPVDMIYSLHSQRVYSGNEDITDFEAALDAEEERKQGLRIPKGVNLVEGLFYREVAKYTPQVQRYLDVFGRENVHVIIFDDFKSDTPRIYRDTCQFLGVDPDFQPEFQVINLNKRIYSFTLHKFLQNPPRTIVSLSRRLVPRPLRHGLIRGLNRVNIRYAPRPRMDPELRRRLQAEFAPEVERLSKLLDRDLTYWCKD